MYYIYSTLTSPQKYTTYRKIPDGQILVDEQILIEGHANITNKNFLTPKGAVTSVTAEQLEKLRANEVFQLHEKNGFIVVEQSERDPNKAAANMEEKDQSAPKVEADFKDKDVEIKTNKKPSKK